MRSTLSAVATCGVLATSLNSVLAAAGTQALTPGSLEGDITTSALQSKAKGLQNVVNLPASKNTRVFGSAGYNSSVAYILDIVNKTAAYDVELQTLPSLYTDVKTKTFSVSVNSTNIPINAMEYTPSTPTGGVSGQLVNVPGKGTPPSSGCVASDYTGLNLKGNIALIQRGVCSFATKVGNATAAGAAAVIIYDNTLTELELVGSLGGFSSTFSPAGGITYPEGAALAARLNAGDKITATVNLDVSQEIRYSSNIIATSKAGNRNNTIVLGSHLDSPDNSPGMNDNGSGSILNAELAVQLAKYTFTNAVRFAWWTSEEFDQAGSAFYISQLKPAEIQQIALYLNFDMIASPNFIYSVVDGNGTVSDGGPAGSGAIQDTFTSYFKAHNLTVIPTEAGATSDFVAFADVAVPFGGLFSGADGNKTDAQVKLFGGKSGVPFDSNFKGTGDNYDNLNFTPFTTNAQAAANVLAQFASSTDAVKKQKASAKQPRSLEGEVVARSSKVLV